MTALIEKIINIHSYGVMRNSKTSSLDAHYRKIVEDSSCWKNAPNPLPNVNCNARRANQDELNRPLKTRCRLINYAGKFFYPQQNNGSINRINPREVWAPNCEWISWEIQLNMER